MRIALYHNLPSGGAKRVAYEHCRRLVAAGHEVVVFQPSTAVVGFCELAEVASSAVTLPFDVGAIAGRGPARLRRICTDVGQALGYGRLARLQERLAATIHEQGFDLLYAHHDMVETAPSLLRLVRLPSVYFCQEPCRAVFEAPLAAEGHPPPPAGGFAKMLARTCLGNPTGEALIRFRRVNERVNTLAATMVLANSTYSCESILRAHGCVARRCTLGVDADFFCPAAEPREDFVLSVGGFYGVKGFRFIIRALGRLPADRRPPLVLAGDREAPGEAEQLHALAREHGVALTTHVNVTDEALRSLYRRTRLFLYAPYVEPLGLTPLEAMACGTAVLGVREGGVRETVIEGVNGRLADRDEGQYAAVLQEMLAAPEELQRLGEQGMAGVRDRWTWERSVQELLGFFDEARRLAAGG
ncbi:glycosyltransferase family 4 protein [bacterium]|nr:glycosyltransferase family 4 protein [bacterium]